MAIDNIRHISSQYVSSLALSDGVDGIPVATYKVETTGLYFISCKYTLRISVSAASAARGGCYIKFNGSHNNPYGDCLENAWDSGGTTSGDIDMTTTKSTFANLNKGDVITIVPLINRRGGTITAYNLYNAFTTISKIGE